MVLSTAVGSSVVNSSSPSSGTSELSMKSSRVTLKSAKSLQSLFSSLLLSAEKNKPVASYLYRYMHACVGDGLYTLMKYHAVSLNYQIFSEFRHHNTYEMQIEILKLAYHKKFIFISRYDFFYL